MGIHEAIDWMQDRLLTTRPLAERTLFSLIAKRRVIETDDGYILSEAADPEDELEKTRQKKRSRGRRRRHVMRQQLQQFMKLDANQIADQIMGGRERGARAKPDDSNAVP